VQEEDEEEDEELDEFGVPVASASGPASTAAAATAAQTGDPAAAAVVGTDQWVQCDRCRTWRIVPDAAWCELGLGLGLCAIARL